MIFAIFLDNGFFIFWGHFLFCILDLLYCVDKNNRVRIDFKRKEKMFLAAFLVPTGALILSSTKHSKLLENQLMCMKNACFFNPP